MIFEDKSKHKKVLFILFLVLVFFGLIFLFWRNYLLKQEFKENVYTNSWESMVMAIENCHVKSIFQTHSLAVSAELKDGRKLKAVEPSIDSIMDIAMNVEAKCGRIQMATE